MFFKATRYFKHRDDAIVSYVNIDQIVCANDLGDEGIVVYTTSMTREDSPFRFRGPDAERVRQALNATLEPPGEHALPRSRQKDG